MSDVAPEILEQVRAEMRRATARDAVLASYASRIANGKGSMEMLYTYAIRLSKHLSKPLIENLAADNLPNGTLYDNIAQKVIVPLLRDMHTDISEVAKTYQEHANEDAGIGLASVDVEMDEDRAEGIARHAANVELDQAHRFLDDAVENFGLHVVDASLEANAEFQWKAGLSVKVVRMAAPGACDWCQSLAHTYDYEKVKGGHEVWSRHRGCRCVLEFNSEKTVWGTKDRWQWNAASGKQRERNKQGTIDYEEWEKSQK